MVNRNILTGELDLDITERFDFGKYKGKLLVTVRMTDPQYIAWLGTTEGRFRLSDTWRQYCEDAAYNKANLHYASYE